MLSQALLVLSLLAQLVPAHFSVEYPYWRGDSFEEPASQYTYPCAGVNQTISAENRTAWPIDGGSLVLDLHHPWTYLFINLALGSNGSSFNVSLTPLPLNETGNGTLCFSKLALPTGLDIQDGTNASLQVATIGERGNALYNCADITFSKDATVLSSDQCKNSTGISTQVLGESDGDEHDHSSSSASAAGAASTASSSSVSTPTSGSSALRPVAAAVSVLGLVAGTWLGNCLY